MEEIKLNTIEEALEDIRAGKVIIVVDDEDKSEYFVHVSGLIDEIKENDTVEFELQEGKKGLNAVNVKVC